MSNLPASAPDVVAGSEDSTQVRGVTKADKAGVGLPFLRLVTGNMRNFIRLRKRWQINDKLMAQGGADFQLQGKKIWPRAEIGYKISDRYGSLVLSESKAVIRKDFKAEVGAVSMKVRCEAGCNLRGKPLFPRIDIDDPKPLNLFLAGALLLVAMQKPLGASKVVPLVEAPVPFTKGNRKAKGGIGVKMEVQVRERALFLSLHELSGVVGL